MFLKYTFNKCAYPTAASRTTVTGTFSFFKASAICRLNTGKNTVWFSERVLQEVARTQFTGSGRSPGWVRLRLGHINGEAFLLCRCLFQHSEDDSGVRVSQDFLRRRRQARGSKWHAKLCVKSWFYPPKTTSEPTEEADQSPITSNIILKIRD